MNPDSPDNYVRLDDVVKMVNNLSRAELEDLTGSSSVDVITRVHLTQYLKDWLVLDNDLGDYMRNIPEGYPRDEALMLGDLLVFMMLGGDKVPFGKEYERPYITLADGGVLPIENRWSELLSKMRSKMPEGKSLSDMVGVHAMVLYSLPQKKYHRYNIEKIFKDDPSIVASFFGEENTRMSPGDYETLNNLRSIVQRGAIEQFRLALSKGTPGLAALSGEGSFGQILMDAFRIAESAVSYFEKGDFSNAVERLKQLQEDYELGQGAFASNLNNMFVATISTLVPNATPDAQRPSLKGNPQPVLMSLDTQFTPEKGPTNMNNAARGAAAVANSLQLWKNKKFAIVPGEIKKNPSAGTNGQKVLMQSEKVSNKMVANGNALVTTDWCAIFSGAYAYGKNLLRGGPNTDTMNTGYNAMFADERRPILKFLVHGSFDQGLQNLLPTGILTVSLTKTNVNYGLQTDNTTAMGGCIVDLLYESFSADDDMAEEIANIAGDDEEEEEFDMNDMDAGRPARKRPSKKKPSMGQMIAIDLVPKTQVQLPTAENKVSWFKNKAKEDESGMLKSLWNEFARGAPALEKRFDQASKRKKWFYKGKFFATKEEAVESYKKSASKLTSADKKKGMSNMTMIYAKRKDNGELVPFRMFLPKILVRRRADKLLPKKGGYYDHVKLLLDTIEADFGTINFKRVQEGAGGFDVDKGRKKVSIDRGVHLVFETEGLDAGKTYSTNARPSRMRKDGSIIYQAMVPTGTSIELEVSG